MAKDLFSEQSKTYSKYRPGYPPEMFEYILEHVNRKQHAWDCATGNGQAAVELAKYFETVDATDISQGQLAFAPKKENIIYQVCPAEQTPFENNRFDLITVAQAYHWLDPEAFEKEARRVGRNNCVVAVWGYNLFHCPDPEIDRIIRHFYLDITGPYWDSARKHIDEAYRNIQFNFSPLPSSSFSMPVHWTKDQLIGFFESWSAVQTYFNKNKSSPIELIREDLDQAWQDPETKKQFVFPLFLRLGRIVKDA